MNSNVINNNKPHFWTTNENLTPENTHLTHTMYFCLVAQSSDGKIWTREAKMLETWSERAITHT